MQTGTAHEKPLQELRATRSVLERIVRAGTKVYGDLTPNPAFLRATITRRTGRLDRDAGEAAARPDSDDSDLYLIATCEQGIASAWRALWTHHLRPLATTAVRVGLSTRDAQEVVVDLLSELWVDTHRQEGAAGLMRFGGIGSLDAWLRTIVRRRAIRWRRRRDRCPLRPGFDRTPAPEPSDRLAEREERQRALSAIAARRTRLSHREAAVVALKYDAGLSQSAIARRLQIGEPRVSRLHRRALSKLTPPRSIAM